MTHLPQHRSAHPFSVYRRRRVLLTSALLAALLLVFGCAAPQIRLDLHATPHLNPSDEGQALPVVVRVYQLKDPRGFEESPFEDLWKQDLTILGADALSRQELVMQPGIRRDLTWQRHPGATHLGVMAVFRDPTTPDWRDIRSLPGGRLGRQMDQRLSVSLHGNRIVIED